MKRYALLPGNKDTQVGDLQFQEYAKIVMRGLASRGFVEAPNDQAEIVIFLSYGIGPPQQHQYAYSMPVYGQTGVASSRTTGTVSGYGTYTANTTYTPTFGVVGSTTHVGTFTTHDRFIVVDAYDVASYQKSRTYQQVWSTTAKSTGMNGDLRTVFPAMVASASVGFGKSTGKALEMRVSVEDPQVLALTDKPVRSTKKE